MKISEISSKEIGKEFSILAQVKSIRQTTGPTVFELKDSTGTIKSTAFSSPGIRAFPDIIIGDTIVAKAITKERNGIIELELQSYEKLQLPKHDITRKPFFIASENLEKLRKEFISAANLIVKTISDSRPIVIRHHDDTDGYTSGYILEKAILPLIQEEKTHIYLSRSSCRTPYYDYIDAMKDLNNYLNGRKRFNEKPPLIILSDLGSNEQSIVAIKRLKMYGIDFVILDHHRFDEENRKNTVVFLNPHVHGLGSDLNAGALATELASFINPELEMIKHLPALSGTADKSSGKDYENYVRLSGFEKEYLEKWSFIAEHELYHLKFSESSEILDDILLPTERNFQLVKLLSSSIDKETEELRKAVKKYASVTEMGKFKLIRIDKSGIGFQGDFASSKLTRLATEIINGPRVTMSESGDSISFRADGVEKFSVISLLDELRQKLPYAFLNGGGHDSAGTIRFNQASKEEIVKQTLDYLQRCVD